jgi:hypothetical protein
MNSTWTDEETRSHSLFVVQPGHRSTSSVSLTLTLLSQPRSHGGSLRTDALESERPLHKLEAFWQFGIIDSIEHLVRVLGTLPWTQNTLQVTSRRSGTHFGTFPELPDRALDKTFHPSGLLWLLSGEMVRSTPYWLGGVWCSVSSGPLSPSLPELLCDHLGNTPRHLGPSLPPACGTPGLLDSMSLQGPTRKTGLLLI